jgi:exonuclease VII small subunit
VDTTAIIEALESERDRLDAAIHALSRYRPGRRRGTGCKRLSAAARAKITAAQKKRWSEQRKKKEKAA